jgi:microcystin-dependent protein
MKSIQHTRYPGLLRHGLLVISSFIIPHSSFAAESPLYIPFQGQVTNQAGVLSADGQYSVIFNLYDQAVGGQPVWSERHVKIGVTKGMINVFLGSITPLTTVDFSQTKYLGITVDVDNLATTADPEMVPRSLIMPAFHAKKAENSTKLAGQDWSVFFVNGNGQPTNDPSTGFLSGTKVRPASITAAQLNTASVQTAQIQDAAVNSAKIADGTISVNDLSTALQQSSVIPPGTVNAFAGLENKVPAGWLLCDGSALRSANPVYSALFSAISTNWGNGTSSSTGAKFVAIAAGAEQTNFNLPDLRGYFLRGVDKSNGIAQNRDVDASSRGTSQLGGLSGNEVGSVQSDRLRTHNHIWGSANGDPNIFGRALRSWTTPSGGFQDILAPFVANTLTAGGGNDDSMYVVPQSGSFHTSPTSTIEQAEGETRPKNAYVNYIIKL